MAPSIDARSPASGVPHQQDELPEYNNDTALLPPCHIRGYHSWCEAAIVKAPAAEVRRLWGTSSH